VLSLQSSQVSAGKKAAIICGKRMTRRTMAVATHNMTYRGRNQCSPVGGPQAAGFHVGSVQVSLYPDWNDAHRPGSF
jgi:hypothetical protein